MKIKFLHSPNQTAYNRL